MQSAELLGPAFPGLTQGELIDKAYATTTGTSGGQLLARELAFVLPVDTINDPDNNLNRRDMLNTVGLQMAYDDSNIAGVSGSGPYGTPTTEDAGAVKTGLEFSIPLSALGSPTAGSPIRITAFVNSGGHDYSSNQYSGTGVLRDNLANTFDLGGIDLRDDSLLVPPIAGDQFVTVNVPAADLAAAGVPEPSAIALGGVALWLLA